MSSFVPLERFFRPRRVAFVGATEDLGKFGGRCVRLLIDFGFRGEIYPVNPNRATIFGLPCYPSIDALPETPDHVGIVLPAPAAVDAVAACAVRGVPFATVFSSGFGETGEPEGRALQAALIERTQTGGLRLMGPNCNGLVNFVDGFALTSTATIAGTRRAAGDIAIASQSGGAGQVNVMWRAQEAGLGISYQVSCGNDADLDLLDYAAFMVESPQTRVVTLLAERIADGDKLAALAERAHELGKPIVMIKVGRTAAGARAAASHTGAVTGEDRVTDAVLAELGILRVDDCAELYETAMLLRRGRIPRGRRAASMAISGGNLVMAADLGAGLGIEWPEYSESTQARLRNALPGFGKAVNPTDMTSALIGKGDALTTVGRAILDDPAIDVLIPVLTMAPKAEIDAIAAISESSAKPVAILWTGAATNAPDLDAKRLVAAGHAVYRDTLPCLKAVRAAMRYGEWHAAESPMCPAGIDQDRARAVLSEAGPWNEARASRFVASYGLPVARSQLVTSAAEAGALAQSWDGTLALKIQSPDLPHKTEAGGVQLDVRGEAAARAAFEAIVAGARRYRPDARIDGVLVQEMVERGHEMFIGVSQDPVFGPIIAVGVGGIYLELWQDVAMHRAPVARSAAIAMIESLRGYRILAGARSRPRADIDALADAIVRISWLAADVRATIAEIDLNPIMVLTEGEGVRVVDALVIAKALQP